MAKTKAAKVLLVLGWLIMQVLLFQQHGVKVVFDSHRFILFTNEILAGEPVTYMQVWRYIGYPAFLLPFFKAGLALKFVIWAQMAVSGIAAIALYKASKEICQQEWLAAGTTALFVFNPDLQAWNCYILTDSLFTSFLTISLCLALLPKKNRALTFAFAVAIIWTILVRPNGFIVLFALAAYFMVKHKPFKTYNKLIIRLAAMLLSLGFYFVLDHFLLKAFTLMIPYERGDMIYGYNGFLLTDYLQPQIPPASLTPLGQVAWFIWTNPFYFFLMVLLKGLFFLIHAKPYYSLIHNLFILVLLLPMYAFAWIGWKRGQVSAPIRALLLTPIVLQAGITMLTIEDWDGRWLFPVLPSIFLFATVGISSLFKKGPFISLT